jgi:hypothetical protein
MNCSKIGLCASAESAPANVGSGAKNVIEFRYTVSGSIPGGVGTGRLAVNIPVHPDSYFVVTKLIASSAGNFTTQIVETGSGSILSDFPIAQSSLWGIAQRPNYLLDPLIIAPSANILFNLINGIAGANAVQLVIEGYKNYDLSAPPVAYGKNPVRPFAGTIKFFQYTANQSLAGNASGTVQTRIQADSNFVIRKMLALSTGNFQIRLSDTASGSLWQTDFIQRDNILGNAQYPAKLSKPRLVKRNSAIQVELTDLSGAPNDIQVVFEGAKIYI